MADLIIYGASDDLIETEGIVRDELNPPYDKPAVVIVKVDDTVWAKVPIEYDPDDSGEWRIQPTAIYAPVSFVAARGEDEGEDEHGCPGYSDKVVIDMGDIEARRISVALEEEN
jgi:hypothetical protein